jgi:deoxyribonuclease V
VLEHSWDISPSESMDIQRRLRDQVVIRHLQRRPRTVAGLDVHDDRSAVAVLSFPELQFVDGAIVRYENPVPYIPGLLAFREVPAFLAAIEQLDTLPDLLLCDGHGMAHPRRFGAACHLGLWLERPTIGCAKSRLCGQHSLPGSERGATAWLKDSSQVIGAVVRTRANVKPVYVSVGHLVDLEGAIDIVLSCAPRYRLPEPLRVAHRMARGNQIPRSAHRGP